MHAAKGLEFPIVVLGDLAMRDSRGDHRIFDRDKHSLQFRVSARDIRLETAGLQEAREGFDARQEAEDRRLLYVAATRARDALVVPMFASDNKASFHRTLVETFPALLAAPAAPMRPLSPTKVWSRCAPVTCPRRAVISSARSANSRAISKPRCAICEPSCHSNSRAP